MTAPDAYPGYAGLRSQWVGRLPAHWGEARIGHIARAWPSNVDKHSHADELPVRLCNYTDVYNNQRITEGLAFMKATATAEQVQRFRLRLGDTVITKDSETADDIGVPAFVECDAVDLVCGYHLAIVRPDTTVAHPRYLYWALRSEPTARQWQVSAAGVTRVGIRSSDLTKAVVPRPPVDEQAVIADYLDRETAKIDALVAKQEQLIVTLNERRAALRASHFVTGEGKQTTTVRRVLRPLNRPAHPGLGVITAYRDGAVTLRSNRRDEGYTFSETENGYQEVRPGDLVFHALDGFAGAVGISDSRGNATPVYHVCRVVTDDDPAYLAMLLRFLGVSGFLATQAPNVRQRSVDFRNWETFARVPLSLPDPEVQRRTVASIRAQTAKTEALTRKAKRFIDLARERRSALITAAVTGQVDVRGAA